LPKEISKKAGQSEGFPRRPGRGIATFLEISFGNYYGGEKQGVPVTVITAAR
jgi:hypothetical protein